MQNEQHIYVSNYGDVCVCCVCIFDDSRRRRPRRAKNLNGDRSDKWTFSSFYYLKRKKKKEIYIRKKEASMFAAYIVSEYNRTRIFGG